MTDRKKLPTDRAGITTKIEVGPVTLYVTVNVDPAGNPLEMFCKADEGWQAWVDVLCETASLALQHGCPFGTIMRHWRGNRFYPLGVPGQGTSIPDAIARRFWHEAAGVYRCSE